MKDNLKLILVCVFFLIMVIVDVISMSIQYKKILRDEQHSFDDNFFAVFIKDLIILFVVMCIIIWVVLT